MIINYNEKELDKFYIGGGRKKTIEKYFGGIEHSTKQFNDEVFNLWKKDEREKRNSLITNIAIPISLAALGIIAGVVTAILQ